MVTVTATNSASVNGDPYIKPVTGPIIKIPNHYDIYRLLQNVSTGMIVNVEVGPISDLDVDNNVTMDGIRPILEGYFMTKLAFRTHTGGPLVVLDLESPTVFEDRDDIGWCGPKFEESIKDGPAIGNYTARTIRLDSTTTLDVQKFDNLQIRSGVDLSFPNGCQGLVLHNYRPELWSIKSNNLVDVGMMSEPSGKRILTQKGIVGQWEVPESINEPRLFVRMFGSNDI